MSVEARIAELKLQLPPAPRPMGNYKPIVVVGNMAYTSGHGPLKPDNTLIVGRVGDDAELEDGYLAARQTALAILATLRDHLGNLDRVRRVIKLFGMVNATPDFTDHPKVINGCSDLFREIWGPDRGVGARSAVGMASLPSNMTTEIEAIFEVEESEGTWVA